MLLLGGGFDGRYGNMDAPQVPSRNSGAMGERDSS